jgi:PAS domain S-box-containing protein
MNGPDHIVNRGWSSYTPIEFSLDENGFIQECSKSVEMVLGYHQQELVWQHISCLFPKLSEVALVQEHRMNQMLSDTCRCGHAFDALSKHGDLIKCNLSFLLTENEGISTLKLIVRPVANATL